MGFKRLPRSLYNVATPPPPDTPLQDSPATCVSAYFQVPL